MDKSIGYHPYRKDVDDSTKFVRDILISVLSDFWTDISILEATCDIDLLVRDSKFGEFGIEIEHRPKYWKHGESFPFSIVSIPARKERLTANKFPSFYVVFNDRGTNCLTTTFDNIFSCRKITKDTTSTLDEDFYDVPLSNFVAGLDKVCDFLSSNLWVTSKEAGRELTTSDNLSKFM